MSVYVVTGKLGSGKSLAAVGRIRTYLQQGRRVATNLDLNLDRMMPLMSRMTATRLPDKPRLEDLRAIGTGDGQPIDDYDESRFGLLVLDELGSWFNTRAWSDKSRAALIEWFLHARKYHWDILLLVQDVEMIDKQLRDSLCEHLVICKRLDRFAVPFIAPVYKLLTGRRLKMPQLHVARVVYGDNPAAPKVDSWWYRAADLFGAYRTGQVFTADQLFLDDGAAVDMRATYTILSAWHLRGRYHQPKSIAAMIKLAIVYALYWTICLIAKVNGRSPLAFAKSAGLVSKDQSPLLPRRVSSLVRDTTTVIDRGEDISWRS